MLTHHVSLRMLRAMRRVYAILFCPLLIGTAHSESTQKKVSNSDGKMRETVVIEHDYVSPLDGTVKRIKVEEGTDFECEHFSDGSGLCTYPIKNGNPREKLAELNDSMRGLIWEKASDCRAKTSIDTVAIIISCTKFDEIREWIRLVAKNDQLKHWPELPAVDLSLEIVTMTSSGFKDFQRDLELRFGDDLSSGTAGDGQDVGAAISGGLGFLNLVIGNTTSSFIRSILSSKIETHEATLRDAYTIRTQVGQATIINDFEKQYRDGTSDTANQSAGFFVEGSPQIELGQRRIRIERFEVTYSVPVSEPDIDNERKPRSLVRALEVFFNNFDTESGRLTIVAGHTKDFSFSEVSRPGGPVFGKILGKLFRSESSKQEEQHFVILIRADAVIPASLRIDALKEPDEASYQPTEGEWNQFFKSLTAELREVPSEKKNDVPSFQPVLFSNSTKVDPRLADHWIVVQLADDPYEIFEKDFVLKNDDKDFKVRTIDLKKGIRFKAARLIDQWLSLPHLQKSFRRVSRRLGRDLPFTLKLSVPGHPPGQGPSMKLTATLNTIENEFLLERE